MIIEDYERGRRRGVVETLAVLEQYRSLDLAKIGDLVEMARMAEPVAEEFDLAGLLDSWAADRQEDVTDSFTEVWS